MKIEIKVPSDAEILLVDDDEQFHTLFRFIYARSALDNPLKSLYSGEEVLAHLNDIIRLGSTPPAMILMDINMPGMDGINTVEKIRQIENFRHTPIIAMLSSSDYPSDIERAYGVGANNYFTKPMDLRDFDFSKAEA